MLKIKKIYVLSFLIFLCFAAIQHKKIKKFFVEQRYYKYLVSMHILKPCYISHPDIETIFAQEGFDYFKDDQKITSNSLKKLEDLSIKPGEAPKIPLVTHHVYFSNINSSKNLDVFFIEKMKTYYTKLNELNNSWQHYIWTNNPSLFPAEVKNIKGVVIKNSQEFANSSAYPSLLDILQKSEQLKPYLAQATDLVRLLAVQKYGGIYTDMDYEIYNPQYLFELMQNFDYIGTRETIRLDSFYANSFFAAKPNHPILNFAVERSFINYQKTDTPEYVKYPCNIYDGILFSGPVLITISYFSKNNIDRNNDIILPSWMGLNKNFARYKNNDCKLSEITKEYFDDRIKNLDVIMSDFTASPVFEEENTKNSSSIYYNIEHRNKYKIIGSDPMCGTWITQGNHQRIHYLNW